MEENFCNMSLGSHLIYVIYDFVFFKSLNAIFVFNFNCMPLTIMKMGRENRRISCKCYVSFTDTIQTQVK